jgi:hypothetical protein
VAVAPNNRTPRKYRRAAVRSLVAAVLTAATTGLALAQNNQAPAAGAPAAQQTPASLPAQPSVAFPPQPPPPALPEPPTEKRGFLNNFGQWWDQSVADFKAKWKDQQTKLDTINKQSADNAKDAATATQQAMKNAADAMRLPISHVIEVQETCPLAGNGAADCATAATDACKGKGFNTGQPLDVRTAEKCNASLWVSGQNPATADCPVETVVLRVACQ